MSNLSVSELTFVLCANCLLLASVLIWACHTLSPRMAIARRVLMRGQGDTKR